MNKHTVAIAVHGGATVFAVVLGFGAVAGAGSTSSASTATATASSAVTGRVHEPSPPDGPARDGGALPVLPAAGACIIGLNCGCIRNITCPGSVHHRPAPSNDHPPDPAAGPGPGGG